MSSEVFDLPSLWSRVDGDADLLREMIAIFAAEYPPVLDRLEAAIERGDAAMVQSAAHKLKGSLVQFSAYTATGTTSCLEDMGKNGSLEGAAELAHRLRAEIADLLQALKRGGFPGATE